MATTASTISGGGYFNIRINGEPVPPTLSLIRSAVGVESLSAPPMMQIELNDATGILRDKYAIVDGTRLSIDVGDSADSYDTQEYRVFTPRQYEDGGSKIISALCVLNKPRYLFDVSSAYKKGTSLDAIKDLAEKGDVVVDANVNPSDSMTWLSVAQPPRLSIASIMSRMWLGEGKYPISILNHQGKLMIRDATEVLQQKPEKKLFHMYTPEDGGVMVRQLRYKSISGLMNSLSNYGSAVRHKLLDGSFEDHDSVKIQADGEVNINSEVKDSLVKTSYSQGHLDPGTTGAGANVHKNWHKAEYNNSKVAGAFTEMCRALVYGRAGINLLSCVEVVAGQRVDSGTVSSAKESGKWIVVGRTWKFVAGRYYEAYLMMRNYTSVEGSTPLSSSSSGNAVQTPVSSTATNIRPTQINSKLKQDGTGLSPLDKLAGDHELKLSGLTSKFKLEGMQFKTPELVQKYGEDADFLDSFMSEFSMASLIGGLCEMLSPLEKMSLSLAFDLGPSLLGALAARIDDATGLLGSFMGDINDLISKGEIPDEYLDQPQINSSCVGKSMDDLLNAVSDKFPSKCVDALSLGKLLGPSLSLSQLVAKLEDYIRDLLCSWGDGTVDGSSVEADANSQVGSLKDYVPFSE